MDVKCVVCNKEFSVDYHCNNTKYCPDCGLIRRRERCNTFHAKKTLLENKRCVDCGKLLRWRSGKRSEQTRCKPCHMKFSGWRLRGAAISNHVTGLIGSNSCNWKGGKRVDKDGYVWIYHPEPHLHGRLMGRNLCVSAQVLVWEQKHNQILPKDMVIHHINKNRSDNRPENLIAMTPFQHKQLHATGNHWRRDAAMRKIHPVDG